MEVSNIKNARESYLDVLKAFSIIAVVLYHAGICTFGYLGVDVFLVISGYLTTRSLYGRYIEDRSLILNWRAYFKFELKKIERLLPTLLIASAVCLFVGYFVLTDDFYESLSQSVLATSFFSNNIVELIAIGDYWWPGNAFAPLMHTWYVGLLMQFYILFPLLFVFAQLNKQRPKQVLVSSITVLGVLSLFFFLSDITFGYKFYLLPARFFEFAAGGLVAIYYKPNAQKLFGAPLVFVSYILLIAVLFVNNDIISSEIKLLLVVAITSVLICSRNILENQSLLNKMLANIGIASYSIYVWHQVILAYYLGVITSHNRVLTFVTCFIIIVVVSWLSYIFIEKRTSRILSTSHGKKVFYICWSIVFVLIQAGAIVVYKHAGVVRDIPELEVSVDNPQRGMWGQYTKSVIDNCSGPFKTNKKHWLVIGNSYGLDFSNMVFESNIKDSVEVSFIDMNKKDYMSEKYDDRFEQADKIFIAARLLTEDFVREVEIRGKASGKTLNDILIVGEKDFGDFISQVYVKRNREDYYSSYVTMKDGFRERNTLFRGLYGERYIDLISMISNENGEVRFFTDENKYFSYDCTHLTRSGARFFAKQINWEPFLQ